MNGNTRYFSNLQKLFTSLACKTFTQAIKNKNTHTFQWLKLITVIPGFLKKSTLKKTHYFFKNILEIFQEYKSAIKVVF